MDTDAPDPGAGIRGDIRLLASMLRANPDLPLARRAWCAQVHGLVAELAFLRDGGDPAAGPRIREAARHEHVTAGSVADVLDLCAWACGGSGRERRETAA
jgi:hypothetical protein